MYIRTYMFICKEKLARRRRGGGRRRRRARAESALLWCTYRMHRCIPSRISRRSLSLPSAVSRIHHCTVVQPGRESRLSSPPTSSRSTRASADAYVNVTNYEPNVPICTVRTGTDRCASHTRNADIGKSGARGDRVLADVRAREEAKRGFEL